MKKHFSTPLIVLLGLLSLDACSPSKSKDNQVKEEAIVVRIQPVTTQAISVPIVTSGAVASKKESRLSFKTGGIIARIYVDEGQMVRKGQVLAGLNLTEISAQASQARQNQEKAQRDLERVKRLYADSAATYEQLQNAATGFEVASSNLQIAQFNLQYSLITAPDNGRILKRFVEEGEMTSPGNPIFTFASGGDAHWIARVGVADRDMVRLKTGDQAQVTLDAYPAAEFSATVTEIAPTADLRNGTFEVELRLHPQGYALASGMVAKITLLPSQSNSELTVPIEALAEADGENGYVYTLNADRRSVRKLPVKVAQLYNHSVVIRSGLKPNDTVITDGVSYLTSDATVRVVK